MLDNSLSDFRKKITTIFILIIFVIYITFKFVSEVKYMSNSNAWGL